MLTGRLTTALITQNRIQRFFPRSLARFSTMPEGSDLKTTQSDTLPVKTTALKATAKAGYRMPRLKKGEEIVAFRPSGHTMLT